MSAIFEQHSLAGRESEQAIQTLVSALDLALCHISYGLCKRDREHSSPVSPSAAMRAKAQLNMHKRARVKDAMESIHTHGMGLTFCTKKGC